MPRVKKRPFVVVLLPLLKEPPCPLAGDCSSCSASAGTGELADGGDDGDNDAGEPISAIHSRRFFKIRERNLWVVDLPV